MARLVAWWHGLPLPWRKWRLVATVDAGDEIPERLSKRTAVLVGSTDHPLWVAFDCPCPERHRVMLNLATARRPCWQIRQYKPLTIFPSIDETRGATRCHYHIRRGRTVWVPNDRSDTR